MKMKRNLLAGMMAGALLLGGTMAAQAAERTVPYPAGAKLEGPAAVQGTEINHKDSPYFTHPDFYAMKGNSRLVLLHNYPTYQQTTEYTCGPAAAITVLYYYGDKSQDEYTLAKAMKTQPYPIGSNPADMAAGLRALGWKVDSSLEAKPFETYEAFAAFVQENLKAGMPVLVENVEWGGHWRSIIGYDTMGTPSTLDDTLIFADPYDTSDHLQDGYAVGNGERFFYMWFDHSMLPESQRNQPWMVIQRK